MYSIDRDRIFIIPRDVETIKAGTMCVIAEDQTGLGLNQIRIQAYENMENTGIIGSMEVAEVHEADFCPT